MNVQLKSLLAGGLLLGICTFARADEKNPECDPARYVGTYKIVSGERDGAPIPKDRLQAQTVIVKEDTIVTYDKDENEVYAVTYTLTTDHGRCHLAMKSTRPPMEGVTPGLMARDGDTLKLIYALPHGEAPKEFKAKEKQHMFVMKLVRSEPDATPVVPKP